MKHIGFKHQKESKQNSDNNTYQRAYGSQMTKEFSN